MGEIIWGAEIPVDGKRPAWLGDDVRVRRYGAWLDGRPGLAKRNGWALAARIRIPADHFAYVALDKGFEPWGGGDAAPDDWGGGGVLLRVGSLIKDSEVFKGSLNWNHSYTGGAGPTGGDIIGYRKRAQPAPTADTVTIARMTRAEFVDLARQRGWKTGYEPLEHFGLIREETLAERFTRETGHEVTPAVEAALSFLSQDTGEGRWR